MKPKKRLEPTFSSKEKQRQVRILKAMIGHECLLEASAKADAVFVKITDGPRIKCEMTVIRNWLERDYVTIFSRNDANCISITPSGETMVARYYSSDFAAQHRELSEETILINDGKQNVIRNLNESPLARLFKTSVKGSPNWLLFNEFSAGERLRADFEFSNLSQKVTASWDPNASIKSGVGGRSSSETMTDRAISARRRLNQAIDAVGPELAGVLLDVCCFLKGLEQIEIERKWPRRSAKLVLKIALSALDRHYTPPQKRRGNDIRHWGASGYRPDIGNSR